MNVWFLWSFNYCPFKRKGSVEAVFLYNSMMLESVSSTDTSDFELDSKNTGNSKKAPALLLVVQNNSNLSAFKGVYGTASLSQRGCILILTC